MATKSFTSEFKFNQKSSVKLADAIEKSRRVEHQIKHTVNDVTCSEAIQKILNNFLSEK